MMIIHYQNSKGTEQFIRDVIHLQNIDNYKWEAVMDNGRSLTLRTAGIGGSTIRIREGGAEKIPFFPLMIKLMSE